MSNSHANPGKTLSEADLKMFARLGVQPGLLEQAGVERVCDREARERYGISGSGDMTGLVFAYFDPRDGHRTTARLRRDRPEIENGRPHKKYVAPFGDRRHLYVLPGVLPLLEDVRVPIVLVEAEKSVLAGTAWAERRNQRMVFMGLGGCYGWRGRIGKVMNQHGESVDEVGALPELAYASEGRIVVVLLDANAATNPKVKAARRALVSQLKSQKANVCIAELPAIENVNGPDDYIFVCGDDAMAGVLGRAIKQGSDTSEGPYSIVDGCICHTTLKEHGPVLKPLCNFSAQVREEIVLDDGVETSRAFVLAGALAGGTPLPEVRIPAPRFSGMSWVAEQWGVGAIVNAGFSTKDQLREGIQRLSPTPERRLVFVHSGWRKIGGEWIYLTSNGAVRREGYEVDLGPELKRYAIPSEPASAADAMQASLRLLSIAPSSVTIPLWSAMFTSVLASVIDVTFSIWFHGPTGSLKSTIAGIFLSHFGSFTESSLPGSWSSTANQLERSAFLLKDCPFVIDDYAPSGLDTRELELKAARLLRAQGNLTGRGRLRSDLTQRPVWFPRGLIISTGEQYPSIQSILARTLLIEGNRKHVDLEALSHAQQEAHHLAHAMAGFVTWLAPQMDELCASLPSKYSVARSRATTAGEHLRLPGVVACLSIGHELATRYALETGVIQAHEADALREECWETLLLVGQQQAQIIEGERPSRRFLSVLAAMLSQGRAVLLRRDSCTDDYFGSAAVLGWQDEDFLYLIPDVAFQVVARFCRDSGEFFPVRSERLYRDLNREGITDCAQGRNTSTARVGGQVRRVVQVKRAQAEALLGEALPGSVTAVTGVTSFEQ